MLKDLVGRVGSTFVGAIVLALAALLATIAASFGAYALLASAMSPAAAAGVTALAFAVVVIVIAALTPMLLDVRGVTPGNDRPRTDPASAVMMMEVAAMAAGMFSDFLLDRRTNQAAKRKQKRKSGSKHR